MRSKFNLSKFSLQRAVLSDMLPFEVPPSFNNGGYFNFLTEHNVQIMIKSSDYYIQWDCSDDSCDAAISLIFKAEDNILPTCSTVKEFEKSISRRTIKLQNQALRTQPFHFEIAHKENDSRKLTVIHPRNQLDVANFYHNNSQLISYYAGLSPFSLRKPARVAKDVFYDDRLHKKRLGENTTIREEAHKEYQYIASYFSYEKYSNIYRFYESYGYHKAERSFVKLLKLDISNCFNSIYTHSMPWALLGIMPTKDYLPPSKRTFGGRFDSLLQNMNNGETNGIVIGPEFSRIFAELILQKVDSELQKRLFSENAMRNKVDYDIFRYVDDFFVFHKTDVQAQLIERHLSSILRDFKLNLNAEKSILTEKPIITNLTVAKNRVQKLLAERIEKSFDCKKIEGTDDEFEVFSPKVNANKLIIGFKSILKETETTYRENLNYTFAAIEKAFKSICYKFEKNRNAIKDSTYEPNEQVLIDALVNLLEFSFFIYSSDQRVNFTVRLTRSISYVVDCLNELAISDDVKNQFFKYAHDNIVRIIKGNNIESYREVETLYLILSLKKLGRNYRIEASTLASYFGFSINSSGNYKSTRDLSMFSITVLLLLLRNASRYSDIKIGLENHILESMSKRKAYAHINSEMLILYLDLIACPYVSENTKVNMDSIFSISLHKRQSIQAINKYWFTNWNAFDLTLELDKKRARQVY